MDTLLKELKSLADGKAYPIPVGTKFSGTENGEEWWHIKTENSKSEDDYMFFRVIDNMNPAYTLELCPNEDFEEEIIWYDINDCDKRTVELLISLLKKQQKAYADALVSEIDKEFRDYILSTGKIPNVAYVEVVWEDDPNTSHSDTIAIDGVDAIHDEDILFYCNSIEGLKALTEWGSAADFKVISLTGFERVE